MHAVRDYFLRGQKENKSPWQHIGLFPSCYYFISQSKGFHIRLIEIMAWLEWRVRMWECARVCACVCAGAPSPRQSVVSVSLIHTVQFCNSTRGWWHGANIIGYDIPVHGALEFLVNWRPQGQSTNSIISMWQPEFVPLLGRKPVVEDGETWAQL